MRGMGKWLCVAYACVAILYLFIHAWSWFFALRSAFWIFVGGAGVPASSLLGALAVGASNLRA
jgi:hypothetical protein